MLKWFSVYGNKLLIIVYFFLVIRYIIGYFLGIIWFFFCMYVLYVYSGLFFWVIIFIILGKLLGF